MFDTMRTAMVDRQLRTAGVDDIALLAALRLVPREQFVPAARRSLAYTDAAVEIAPGRWLMAPMSLAQLLNHAAVGPADRVLVVGAGTGYAAALLAQITRHVTALEENPALAAAARGNGIAVVEGPLTEGWAKAAPYDLIVCDGAVATVPPALLAQLAETGRLAAIVIGDDGVGRATVGRAAGGHFAGTGFIEAGAAILPGFARTPQFVF